MFKSFEKRFAKWETQKRLKLGNDTFLNRYTKEFSWRIKSSKIFTLISVVLSFVLALGWLFIYLNDKEVVNLIIMILWFFTGVSYTVRCILYYTHRFAFWETKVKQWNEELEIMKRQDRLQSEVPVGMKE